jgi:hypothetical protein
MECLPLPEWFARTINCLAGIRPLRRESAGRHERADRPAEGICVACRARFRGNVAAASVAAAPWAW